MAYAQDSNALKAAPDTVAGVVSDLNEGLLRLSKINACLVHIGDRLEGSRPSDVGEVKPAQPPHSLIDELQRKRSQYNELLSRCEREIERIEGSLGIAALGPKTPGQRVNG